MERMRGRSAYMSAGEVRRMLCEREENVSGALREVLEGLGAQQQQEQQEEQQERQQCGCGNGESLATQTQTHTQAQRQGQGQAGAGAEGVGAQAVREAACEAVCGMLCAGAVGERGDCGGCVGLLLGELDVVGAAAAGRMSEAIVGSCVGGGAEEAWRRSAAPGCQLKLLQKCLAVADLGGEEAAPWRVLPGEGGGNSSNGEDEDDEDEEDEEEDSDEEGSQSPSLVTDCDEDKDGEGEQQQQQQQQLKKKKGTKKGAKTTKTTTSNSKKKKKSRKDSNSKKGAGGKGKRGVRRKSGSKGGGGGGAWTERAVERLCTGGEWPRAGLQAIVHEVAGLRLERGQRERVARKAVASLRGCEQSGLFGYAFELLCLCGASGGSCGSGKGSSGGNSSGNRVEEIVMGGLTRHVERAERMLEAAARSGPLERDVAGESAALREAEGSVVFAASLVASQDEALVGGLVRGLRDDRRLVTPFALAALLAISASPRLEGQVYDALRSLIADAQRVASSSSSPWAKAFLSSQTHQTQQKEEEDEEEYDEDEDEDEENGAAKGGDENGEGHERRGDGDSDGDGGVRRVEQAFLEVAELSAQHWDFTTGPLTKFGFHLIDHAYSGTSAAGAGVGTGSRSNRSSNREEARVGRGVLRALFVGHEANVKGAILEQICGRIATAAPDAAACYVDVLEALVAENPSGVLSLSSKVTNQSPTHPHVQQQKHSRTRTHTLSHIPTHSNCFVLVPYARMCECARAGAF